MRFNYCNTIYDIDDVNICPHCHVAITPIENSQIISKDTDNTPVHIGIWTCSNQACQKVFVTLYKKVGNDFKFGRFLNGLPKGPIWPKPIAELRSGNPKVKEAEETTRFIKTYLQSLVAENNGLDELAGMGYRKAIEYLVKDWAIRKVPDDKEKIESLWLGQVISKYFDGDLEEILERAT